MRRRDFLIVTVVSLLSPLVWGCSGRTGVWGKGAIESKLKDELKLKEIHLTETEHGKYEGTGTGVDGTVYKIKATQSESKKTDLKQRELRWEAEGPKDQRTSGHFIEGGNQ
jgi:hypothetical protein